MSSKREYSDGPVSVSDNESVAKRAEYNEVDKRTAKELYYLMGDTRTHEAIAKLMDINVSSIKSWSTEGNWKEYVRERAIADDKLALSGKFSSEVLAKNTKAKVVLELIVEAYMKKLLGKNGHLMTIQSSDALNAAKALMGLIDNDKQSDIIIKGKVVTFVKDDDA
jgi:hypothetical protein